MDDVAFVCNESGVCNEAVLYSSSEAEEPAWCWYQWNTYLSTFFTAPSSIASYFWFKVESRNPGVLQCCTCPRGKGVIVEQDLIKISARPPNRPKESASQYSHQRYKERLLRHEKDVILLHFVFTTISNILTISFRRKRSVQNASPPFKHLLPSRIQKLLYR